MTYWEIFTETYPGFELLFFLILICAIVILIMFKTGLKSLKVFMLLTTIIIILLYAFEVLSSVFLVPAYMVFAVIVVTLFREGGKYESD